MNSAQKFLVKKVQPVRKPTPPSKYPGAVKDRMAKSKSTKKYA